MTSHQSFASTSWSLCGFLYCKSGLYDSTKIKPIQKKELICQQKCSNIGPNQRFHLDCQDGDADNPEGLDPIGDNQEENIKLCDEICDTWNCIDESTCNGYLYGRICLSSEHTGLIVNPPYQLCDGNPDCLYSNIKGTLDEKHCNINPNVPGLTNCISSYYLLRKNVRKLIPIFNYTRCAAITYSRSDLFNVRFRYNQGKVPSTPYCQDYIDQTNCTDETRVAVSCFIQGYGYSTISKTMVCGKLRRGLCLDGMDVACVDVNPACTLHKHQLCDGVEDCLSGFDEKHPWCAVMTDKTCYRNYRTNKKLHIPAVWLSDGMMDCLSGLDENWDIECGHSLATKRYEVRDICEDVFLCRYGDKKFVRLTKLCNGIEKCSNENRICEIGRGLASLSTFISHRATATKSKTISFCSLGLEDLATKICPCVSRELNPFNEDVFGMGSRTKVSLPSKSADCRFIFGEPYVILSCLGMCKNSECPLRKPVNHQDCPLQLSGRIYTVVNRERLTFVQRRGHDYHNDYFVCANRIVCVDYDKVCNLWDDCGDGSDEENCSNNFICKDNQGVLPISKKCDGYPDCWDISDECNSQCGRDIINQSMLKGAAWFIGSVAVLSNVIILFENACSLKECFSGQALANKLLIILIGIGDFLIGVYLLCIAVADSFIHGKDYCSKRFEWLTSRYCSALGVISTFGTFLSLFSLTILSIIRAFKLATGDLYQRPESREISRKDYIKILALILFITSVAVAIASLSLFDFLEDFFVNGLVYDKSIKIFHGQVGKTKHLKVIQAYYGRSRHQTLTWKLIQSLIGSMFSNEYGNLEGKVSRVDFYGNDGVCLFKFFVTADDPQRVFSLVVLSISVFCFAIVTTAYVTINIITFKSSRSFLETKGPTANALKKRNQKLQRKIATIIVTDFLCWIPFVLVCFLHYFGVLDATSQYGLFSIIIIPINSIINPFLYSELMQECFSNIWIRISSFLDEILAKLCKNKIFPDHPEHGHEGGVGGLNVTQSNSNKGEVIQMVVIRESPGDTSENVHREVGEGGNLSAVPEH